MSWLEQRAGGCGEGELGVSSGGKTDGCMNTVATCKDFKHFVSAIVFFLIVWFIFRRNALFLVFYY